MRNIDIGAIKQEVINIENEGGSFDAGNRDPKMLRKLYDGLNKIQEQATVMSAYMWKNYRKELSGSLNTPLPSPAPTPSPIPTPTPEPTPVPVPDPVPTPIPVPDTKIKLFKMDTQLEAMVPFFEMSPTYEETMEAIGYISSQSQGKWLGEWNTDLINELGPLVKRAKETGSTLVLIPYYLPHRDAGGESRGGAKDAWSYKIWIDNISMIVGDCPVIYALEPDSIGQLNEIGSKSEWIVGGGLDEYENVLLGGNVYTCRQGILLGEGAKEVQQLAGPQTDERIELIKYAIRSLKKNPNAKVFLDGTHSGWLHPRDLASRLIQLGVENADGFASNVSNRMLSDKEIAHCEEVIKMLPAGKTYIIDTSRNAIQHTEWCNPAPEGLGDLTLTLSAPHLYANLWLKSPGESDGYCGGSPVPAGGVWLDRVLMLYRNRKVQ